MNDKTIYERGTHLYEVNRFQLAIEEYLKIPPDSVYAAASYIEIALCYSRLKEYEKTIEFAKKGLEIKPNYPYAFYLLGETQLSLESPEKAIHYLRLGLELKPDDTNIQASLGKAYGRIGEYDKGLHFIAEALKTNPTNSTALTTKMEIYARLGLEADFVSAAKKALAAAPNDEHAHGVYAWGNMKFGIEILAKKHYKIALQINPNAKYAADALKDIENREELENELSFKHWGFFIILIIILILLSRQLNG